MLYAKSKPEESIWKHTKTLLQERNKLKEIYGKKIKNENLDKERFWELLKLACTYHDLGKSYTPFQNILLKDLGMENIPTLFSYDNIKHEQLSPLFIPKDILLNKQERKLLYQAIYYHHERNDGNLDKDLVTSIIDKDILPRINELEKELNIPIEHNPNNMYLGYVGPDKRITEESQNYIDYCLLKGLLHRLDYSASAHLPVEEEAKDAIANKTLKFMKNRNFRQNDLQKFASESADKNIIAIGSTGMGKTEAALLWSKNDKTFFTLPIRVSINAIYDRIKNTIRYKNVGLLHSTALNYLEENEEYQASYELYEKARNLSSKFTVCTIDQIFPFACKYRGYEKIYATFSYSKIIIDEIQAYSPKIVAILIQGLEMINKIGGKFMIMTATLPRIYKEELEKRGIPFEFKQFTKDTKRHKIKFQEKEILDDIEKIKEEGKTKKVLVIVNTVDKAIEVYQNLKNRKIENIYLLHSRFILQDRTEKEEEIMNFSKGESKGIWITTQLVEASLDIDFDILFTEMSTLDSLFQRLGRCYRGREYNEELTPNIYIYKVASGIGSVYHKEIYEKSVQLIKEYNESILEEKTKIQLVDKLYSREMLKGTSFLKEFDDCIFILKNIIDYEKNKKDAQKLLRDIDNITIIPKSIYDKNLELFEQYEKEGSLEEKRKLKRKIDKLTTTIRKNKEIQFKQYISLIGYGIKDMFIIDLKYDKEVGLILKEDIQYDIESRTF